MSYMTVELIADKFLIALIIIVLAVSGSMMVSCSRYVDDPSAYENVLRNCGTVSSANRDGINTLIRECQKEVSDNFKQED